MKKKETRGRYQAHPLSEKIIKMFPHHSNKEISEKLNIEVVTIRNIGTKHKLKKVERPWTKKDEKLLIAYYEGGLRGLADILPNRTRWSMINKYRELKGLRKK